jgi:hypothetical protein
MKNGAACRKDFAGLNFVDWICRNGKKWVKSVDLILMLWYNGAKSDRGFCADCGGREQR